MLANVGNIKVISGYPAGNLGTYSMRDIPVPVHQDRQTDRRKAEKQRKEGRKDNRSLITIGGHMLQYVAFFSSFI